MSGPGPQHPQAMRSRTFIIQAEGEGVGRAGPSRLVGSWGRGLVGRLVLEAVEQLAGLPF